MNPNYVTIVKQDLDKLLNTQVSLPQWRKLVSYPPSLWSQKRMASSKFVWIFDDSMLQLKKIHIYYLLLKKF
jgi:hypothetical protein